MHHTSKIICFYDEKNIKFAVTIAGIAQLVEHDLAKVGVASSSLVSRSVIKRLSYHSRTAFFVCRMYAGIGLFRGASSLQ